MWLDGGRVAEELLLVEVGVVGAVEPLERVEARVAEVVETGQLHLRTFAHLAGHVERHHADRTQICLWEDGTQDEEEE